MSKLIIYKASAGSGKTFKLAEEYLRLAFKIPFNHILAVTFTNKATAEMKQRITGVLYDLASGRDSPYLQILVEETGMDEKAVRLKSESLLHEILHNYSRFSIGTIDSFFQTVIRGFARETGLESGFELELDNGRVLSRVIDRLIVKTSANPDLRRWLSLYAESRIREGLSWNFRRDVSRLGSEVFNETVMNFRHDLKGMLSDREGLKAYISSLHALRSRFEKSMHESGSDAIRFMVERGLSVSDFSYSLNGVAGYFEKISSKKSFEPGIRVVEAVNDPAKWVSKSSVRREDVINAVEGGLGRYLASALEHYNHHYSSYVGAGLILSNSYTLGILNDIIEEIREYAQENNVFLLSDVASLLAGVIGANDTPFIYEKTGYFYRHYMIDEFQDTSAVQWKNFIPLITESLAGNNRNILVGDVKQSIYRWRNGDWKILAGGIEKEMKIFNPLVRSLEINWRSKKNIIDFNNYLFNYGPDLLREQFRMEYRKSGVKEIETGEMEAQIVMAYKGHAQKIPDDTQKEGGCVEVQFVNNSEGDWQREVMGRLPALITDILARGYSLKDIAILVRNNRDGKEIAGRLMEWQAGQGKESGTRMDFVSDEFLLVEESVSVRLILSLLQFLLKPGDLINKALIVNEYRRYLQKPDKASAISDNQLFTSVQAGHFPGFDELVPESFLKQQRHLSRLPLYELVERLIEMFNLNDNVSEIPYLMAFQDAVTGFTAREGGGAGPFLDWWEENGGRLAVTSNDKQDALRIMTIHKAKGLQFKVVVLPFGDWLIDHNPLHDNFIWCRPDREPFDKFGLVPVRYKSEMAKSIFVHDYFNEKMQVFVDNINLLYVALTRAEEELFVFSPFTGDKRNKEEKLRYISELLRKVLSGQINNSGNVNAAGKWDGETGLFALGERHYKADSGMEGEDERLVALTYPVNDFKNKLRFRSYGSLFFTGTPDIGQRIDRGKLMHEIFQDIVTSSDIERAVMKKHFDGIAGREEAEEIILFIRRAIGESGVANWFDGTWEVRNEAGLLLKDGSVKRPDRVMLKGGRAVVVDYKFGENIDPGYKNQVRKYMKELGNMGYVEIDGYVWYVAAGQVDEVGI